MDPIVELYQAMKNALASGHSMQSVEDEIARRGFTLNGNRASFTDLANRANEVMSDQARGPVTLKGVLSSITHGATLGLDKYMIGDATAQMEGPGSFMQRAGMWTGNPPVDADRSRAVRDSVRQTYEDFRARHPGVSLASEIGGSFALPPYGLSAAKSFPAALGRASAIGGVTGAISGAADAPDSSDALDRLKRAGIFGAGGALLSLPFAAAGHVLPNILSAQSRGNARLVNAIDASGGPDAIRAAAAKTAAAGRADVNPIGSLSPYLQGEAEYAATRSPSVYAQYRKPMLRAQSDEADRLIDDVSGIFGEPVAGDEALRAQRRAQFDPVYEALNKSTGRIEDPRVANLLSRPVVRQAYQEAVNTGIIADKVESLPSFGQLNELRETLFSMARSLEESPGGNKRRMAALYDAAREAESILEDNSDDFRALQNAYREASRPINVIDLARLETARRGRVSPALDRAGRADRAALLDAFGSQAKYDDFMSRVEQERNLGDFNAQVFGGSKTVRAGNLEAGMQPEDLAKVAYHPAYGASRAVGHAIGGPFRDATGRAMAPSLFGPVSGLDDVLEKILGRRRTTAGVTQNVVPKITGLFPDWLMGGH